MKPVDQTIHDPDLGNCFNACVASILELPLSEVPFFMTNPGWWIDFLIWLSRRGLEATYYVNDGTNIVPPGFAIANGPSKRFAGRKHSCVAYNGVVVHDPHDSRDGLPSGIDDFIVIHGPDRAYRWFNGI